MESKPATLRPDDLREIRRRNGNSASEHAVNTLVQAIRDGVYGAGARLVESRLTQALGVSRGTLREVFRRLEADGLVRLEANRGAIVRALTRQDIIELLQVRELLEGFAARLAAQRSSDIGNQARIRQALETIGAARRDPRGFDYLEDNEEFHRLILELSGNRTLAQQIRQLQMPYMRARYFDQLKADDWNRSLNEHEQILQALLDADEVLAEQLMRAHVRRTRRVIEGLPDAVFGRDQAQNAAGAA
jgi:DNA-binding GntR family transcriptional regulator